MIVEMHGTALCICTRIDTCITQGTLITAGLDGLVRVWQPLDTPVPGAVLESAPVYSHPPEEEGPGNRVGTPFVACHGVSLGVLCRVYCVGCTGLGVLCRVCWCHQWMSSIRHATMSLLPHMCVCP